MGLGAYPGTDPQFVGMLGMHGTYEANMAMQYCDVLVAIGARFDDRVISVPSHFLAQPKKSFTSTSTRRRSPSAKVDIPIVGNVKDVLIEMIAQLKAGDVRPDAEALGNWWTQVEAWRAPQSLWFDQPEDIIKPQFVVQSCGSDRRRRHHHLRRRPAPDVCRPVLQVRPPQAVDQPGGLGTMGFGLPAAMGAQLANPDATVACITGEASIQMNIQELSTCKQYHVPVKIVNLNNRYLGMVRQWQEFFYGNRYSESYMDALPDFVKLAEAYGHVGMRIERPADVEPALREAMKLKERLVFLDFLTDQKANVFPMVGNGKGLNQMDLPRTCAICSWAFRPTTATTAT